MTLAPGPSRRRTFAPGPSRRRTFAPSHLLVALLLTTATTAAAQPSGEALYKLRCAACHDNADGRTPPKQSLQNMTPSRIMRTMDFGAMMTVAYALNREEREAVARYLGKPGPEPVPPPAAYCSNRAVRLSVPAAAWNGWSATPENTRFVPAPVAGIAADRVPGLKLKWAFGFEGDISAFAQPTVIDGHVFVGSAGGVVHALRADSGCLLWTFQATGPIRSAIVAAPVARGAIGQKPDATTVLLFGDLTGWFYALDARDGSVIWKKRPEDHESVRLSAPPVIHNGLAIIPVASWEESRSLNPEYACCTFRGSLTAMRIADGTIAWKTYMVPTPAVRTGKTSAGAETWGPSGVGVWSSPTLDLKRRRLYVTTGNNYSLPATPMSDAIVALDLDSGKILWWKQALPNDVYNSACGTTPKGPSCVEGSGPDYDFGSPPLLVRAGGRELLLAGQKSGIVWAFDPEKNGEVVWQTRVGQGGINGGVQWGMASDGERVFAATSEVLVQRTATARILDPKAGGGLTALRIADGSRAWHVTPDPCGARPNCSPAQSAALTAIGGVVFSGSLDGHVRGYTAASGEVVWDFDTARPFDTVNGVKATGGAIDGPGVVVSGGMLFVNSGYTRYGGMAGNVLLAFAP
jgi:polyvinyl alcohol dehydrogenase (cytochrome)